MYHFKSILGYWSGSEPTCRFPSAARPRGIPSRGNGVGGNGHGGAADITEDGESSSSAGVWIGIALGVIVILGLLGVGIYFYRKQQNLQTKPSRYL